MKFNVFLYPLGVVAIAALTACGSPTEEVTETTEASSEQTLANGMTVKEQIEARQAGFKKLGKAFKAISDQLRSGDPDMSVIQTAAAGIPEDTDGIEGWFPAGTGPESGVKTEALPAIWEKPEEFAQKVGNFKAAATALAAAAQSGDATVITAAFRTAGGTCKGCHDTFRLDD